MLTAAGRSKSVEVRRYTSRPSENIVAKVETNEASYHVTYEFVKSSEDCVLKNVHKLSKSHRIKG